MVPTFCLILLGSMDDLMPCLAGKVYLYEENVSIVGARSNTLVSFSCAEKAKRVRVLHE